MTCRSHHAPQTLVVTGRDWSPFESRGCTVGSYRELVFYLGLVLYDLNRSRLEDDVDLTSGLEYCSLTSNNTRLLYAYNLPSNSVNHFRFIRYHLRIGDSNSYPSIKV